MGNFAQTTMANGRWKPSAFGRLTLPWGKVCWGSKVHEPPWPKWLGTKTHHETSVVFLPFFERKTVESGNSSYLCWSERCYLDDELDLLNSCTFRSHNMHPQFPCTEGCFQGCVPVVQQQPRENAIIIVKLWVHSGQKKMANRGKPKAKNGYLKTKHDKMGYTQGYFFLS